jgi:hypothetical protein
MEKYIVFGPIILFFGVFGILVVLFLGFVAKIIFKTKNSYWKGKVIEKKYVQKEEDDKMHEYFSVMVEPEDGGRIMGVAVSKILYNNIKEGDIIEKKKGDLLPKKVS